MASGPPSSPSSSPRLPSPPPMAEDQTGPQSPAFASNDKFRLEAPPAEHAASRRIRPGTKAAEMAEGPPLIDLVDIDSPFQLTEHLKSLHYTHTHPISQPDHILPITSPIAHLLAAPPLSIDRALWLYELCRFLVQQVNLVITSLFADSPPCSSTTCPEMRASEWQYLCAVHDPPKACCAIDYCCHTLDWAANVLTSPKQFPSRLALGGADTNSSNNGAPPQYQVRQLTNIFRRVYRIFAHAWFQHRDMFWRVEGRTGLYIFFKTVCDVYNLIPEDGYTIPPEAENKEPLDAIPDTPTDLLSSQLTPSILQRTVPPTSDADLYATSPADASANPINTVVASGATARRHRQTPSKGSNPSVETVPEENEEDDSSTIDNAAQPHSEISERYAPPEPLHPTASSSVYTAPDTPVAMMTALPPVRSETTEWADKADVMPERDDEIAVVAEVEVTREVEGVVGEGGGPGLHSFPEIVESWPGVETGTDTTSEVVAPQEGESHVDMSVIIATDGEAATTSLAD